MSIGKKGSKKAQTWSVDLVLGVVMFLLIVVIIYSLIASRSSTENPLRDDADRIYVKLNAEENPSETVPSILNGNSISEEELEKLYTTDYLTLKDALGISSDSEFCILILTDNNAIISAGGKSSMGTANISLDEGDIVIGDVANNLYCGE